MLARTMKTFLDSFKHEILDVLVQNLSCGDIIENFVKVWYSKSNLLVLNNVFN